MLSFDALYSISDLHLGGPGIFQIVDPRAAMRLAAAITGLATRRPGERVALVLNGDIIDTLAERGGPALRIDDGIAVLARIADDPTFRCIFDALGVFARQEGRTLVVGIGNHDLELAVPEVQEAFVRRVAGDDASAAARIRFTPPCQPMLFAVGGHRVFVTHGNEVDEWNVVDADQLIWAIDRHMRGLSFDADGWRSNAGTRLVLEVMNGLKARHPFVDLLKPEMGLAVPMLVALDRSALREFTGVATAFGQSQTTKPRRLALLGEDRTARPAADLLGEALTRALASDPRRGSDYLLEAERRARSGETGGAEARGTLGVGSLFGAAFVRDLRSATLDWLGDDKGTFDPAVPADMDQKLIDRIGPGVSVVIAGHTHLPRSLKPRGRDFLYLNTGTWARVIELDASDVEDTGRWKEVEATLRAGSMAALDDPDRLPWKKRALARTTGLIAAVEVVEDGGRRRVRAGLERHTDPAGESDALQTSHLVGDVRP